MHHKAVHVIFKISKGVSSISKYEEHLKAFPKTGYVFETPTPQLVIWYSFTFMCRHHKSAHKNLKVSS